MGEVPAHLQYFKGSMYEAVAAVADRHPNAIAFDFMGRSASYRAMMKMIDQCACALHALGVHENDAVTIALPNSPQAIIMLYATNRVGAVANMVHPLSAEKEIEFFLHESNSVAAITLDQFCGKFKSAPKLIVTSVADAFSLPMKVGYMLTRGRNGQKRSVSPRIIQWRTFLKSASEFEKPSCGDNDSAVILYSGGTTGTTKGIVLTNKNFNALGQQVIAANPMFRSGDRMLAAMPMFHGFGLGVCIHAMLSMGGRCVLIPQLSAEIFAKQIVKYRCNFIAGVPALYEAMLRMPNMDGKDLSFLKGVFSGGDSLSSELKKKIDIFLADHHASICVREGYGTTETVTACCLTPPHLHKEGSIGLPFPDTYIKIVEPGTSRELPYGQEGEILLSGPTVMKEYLHHPEETAKTLRTHSDGLSWVYTGDLGTMDADGFVYFIGRAKRVIITGGYNVYPRQIENVLDAYPKVKMSCVIGVPDRLLKQKVKAFVVLSSIASNEKAMKRELLDYCREYVASYAIPYDIEFRDTLPKTLVGKVAYHQLEEEENAKHSTE